MELNEWQGNCPKCGGYDVEETDQERRMDGTIFSMKCTECNHEFRTKTISILLED